MWLNQDCFDKGKFFSADYSTATSTSWLIVADWVQHPGAEALATCPSFFPSLCEIYISNAAALLLLLFFMWCLQ